MAEGKARATWRAGLGAVRGAQGRERDAGVPRARGVTGMSLGRYTGDKHAGRQDQSPTTRTLTANGDGQAASATTREGGGRDLRGGHQQAPCRCPDSVCPPTSQARGLK